MFKSMKLIDPLMPITLVLLASKCKIVAQKHVYPLIEKLGITNLEQYIIRV